MQFQLDAETLSHSLERLSSTLDPQSLSNKSNPEILLALEVRFRGEDVSIQGDAGLAGFSFAACFQQQVWLVSEKTSLFVRALVHSHACAVNLPPDVKDWNQEDLSSNRS